MIAFTKYKLCKLASPCKTHPRERGNASKMANSCIIKVTRIAGAVGIG